MMLNNFVIYLHRKGQFYPQELRTKVDFSTNGNMLGLMQTTGVQVWLNQPFCLIFFPAPAKLSINLKE